jgi:hypothetical protein
MNPSSIPISQLVQVRPEPPGQFTAQAVGLPEIRATAASPEEAIDQVAIILKERLARGELVQIQLRRENPELNGSPCLDPNDPLEKEFLEDLKRFREEDLQRALGEYDSEDQACSDSSSTPTT